MVFDLFSELSISPLFHLTLTIAAYLIGLAIYRRAGMTPLLNPVLIAVAIVVAVLLLAGISYRAYFLGAQFLHFLLGPATVSLAIPLYRHFGKVRRAAAAILISLLTGSAVAASSAVGIAWVLGGSEQSYISLAPKSVTAPVAMGITEVLGGSPSLTAVMVIITGILGAVLGPYVLNMVGVTSWAARGLAMGTASHGIGTARALQVNEEAGAFSGLAMGLNALLTAILLPIIWYLIF
ncbi:TIGR00659 family protein [Cohaesibacter sp. ES.047]|uniref:LrgB family protein n=1 Tax=Cohaesibacter sp. ES.047 TaxID=1798205 RepID=UPI000BB7266F|nr:LrgB family protein [Cohaesibacter sp. ES.047]SNY92520.1 TIGR00659 family protein [Cohaesibacter sp. ES.047]